MGLGDKKLLILPRARERRRRQVLAGKTEKFMKTPGCQGKESAANQKQLMVLG